MADDRKRADNAKHRRGEQLKRWLGSETDLEPPVFKKKKTRVKFDDGAVFLAACSSGDTEEVKRLLDHGADINYANVDGLTALHQACIDENLEMVKFLVEHSADTNQPDNEGWTPLHAVASCGYINIAEYLINNGANVAAVNSEGEIPSDIAEESAMKDLLQDEVNKQGIDVEAARKEEEHRMLQDARQWLNSGRIEDIINTKSGGTALHVAAAKGYLEVLKLLIQAGYDVNVKDNDGWTPLHAAAHWCKEEACRILVENFSDMEAVNKVGQTPFDLADESIIELLEELQKKQNILRTEKRAVKSTLIESTVNCKVQTKHLSEDTIFSEDKETKYKLSEREKINEESKKDESSTSSSEEEDDASDSESDVDTEKSKPSIKNNINSKLNSRSLQHAPTTGQSTRFTATTTTRKIVSPFLKSPAKDEEGKDESPASWRLGLRKTGSHDALSEISSSQALKEKDSLGIIRSASSPRLSTIFDNRDKDNKTRLVYVAPTIPNRRLHSSSDIEEKENRESAASLVRSGSYTRRQWKDDFRDMNHMGNESSMSVNASTTNTVPLYQRRSYLTPVRDEEAESQRKARSRQARQTRRSTQGVTLTDLQEAEKTFSRSRAERRAREQQERDEKEKQDVEKQDEKEKPLTTQDTEEYKHKSSRNQEEESGDRQSRYTSQPDSQLGPLSSPSTSGSFQYSGIQPDRVNGVIDQTSYSSHSKIFPKEMENNGASGKAVEGDKDVNDRQLSIRERRRPREKRRSTGVSYWTQDGDENDGKEEEKGIWHDRISRLDSGSSNSSSVDSFSDRLLSRTSSYTRRENRLSSLSKVEQEDSVKDYKKLYEEALTENEKLKAKLQEAQLELSEVKTQLEKATQKQDRISDKSSMLEMEKREKRALERKVSEMEEELKVLTELKSDNQRLKDENGALIRVISKLSK
ncbi:protein phosphatase 1 regulatory subunit 12B-like isoform X2 [Stegostoma tigrinum]|uniref:protein phosphatase 1 regulatory subunit 12B-like isoform X2 n=1 Tax=Stegostoma tigrinum TaxID=3053191 RepID=UPI00202B8FCE|nr:protein phosphatase 1 regulatory subunit 12B-like isoform X2 [Stegostoma tigrinum]